MANTDYRIGGVYGKDFFNIIAIISTNTTKLDRHRHHQMDAIVATELTRYATQPHDKKITIINF